MGGLELVLAQNFHEYFVRNFEKPMNLQLLHKMNVLGDKGTFPAEQWEIAYLYKVFVFKKSEHGQDGVIPRRKPPPPRTYTEESIIRLKSNTPDPLGQTDAMEDDDEDYDISAT